MKVKNINRGEYLIGLIKANGFKLADIIKARGISRTTLFNWGKTYNLETEKMQQIINFMGIEEPKEFILMKEQDETIKKMQMPDYIPAPIKTKSIETKYTELLENYNTMQLKYIKALEEISQLKMAP